MAELLVTAAPARTVVVVRPSRRAGQAGILSCFDNFVAGDEEVSRALLG